ncbi:hypothetical protein [Falsiroseomonas sp.]|uniref:hypothetical protein n=1 Tax=Falsiroseomonas sp. TaxID=2870721 RepID=UPI003F701CFE
MHNSIALRSASLVAASALLLTACVAQQQRPVVSAQAIDSFVADHPPELRRLSRQVPIQGDQHRALNQMRSGLAALDLGRLDLAAASFDDALQIIEAIYADNPAAERARSVWYAESTKDFKGEPYERAMAYYYRGLIYLMQGDYQNARASFRGGLLQDTFMEENTRMASDFGAMAFLEGWAARCAAFDRQTVEASFTEARSRNANLPEPPAENNMLLIFEAGTGPNKGTAGSRRELLSYSRGSVPALARASFQLGPTSIAAAPAEDLFYQAATRAGRWVDLINQGKVVYQTNTAFAGGAATAVGAGLLAASAFQGNHQAQTNMAAAGAAVMLVGLIAQAAAESMKTEADARFWDNLPANLLFGTAPRPMTRPTTRRGPQPAPVPAPTTVQASFERGGRPMQRELAVRTAGACSIAWGREVPALSVPDTAPYTLAR